MKFVVTILLCLTRVFLVAQSVEVPKNLEFAGIRLVLTEEARAKVQEKVNSLMQSLTYFNPIVERADLFLPLVEAVLKQENIPNDFKYSPIHESLLIGTAVSSSNALGYWQFKANTAIECFLRVDEHIDQRMNIVNATQAACVYLNKNYPRLKNWLFTLLAYNLGATGAENYLNRYKIAIENSSVITLEGELARQPYILYYLAYKVAFEGAIYKEKRNLKLLVYQDCKGKKLQDVSEKTGISLNDLKAYNPWLMTDVVPDDEKKYYMIIPVPVEREKEIANLLGIKLDQVSENTKTDVVSKPFEVAEKTEKVPESSGKSHLDTPNTIDSPYPIITDLNTKTIEGIAFTFANINGLKGFIVDRNYDVSTIADALKMSSNRFRKINDLEMSQPVKEGMVYYLEKKKTKADVAHYDVVKEDNLWEVSQNLGVQLKYLAKYNELSEDSPIQKGLVIWAQEKRPKHIAPEIKPLATKKEDKSALPAEPKKEDNDIVFKTSDIEVTKVEKTEEGIIVEEGFYYVKEDEESIFSIARQFNVSVLDLKAWNNLSADLSLKKGQILRVKAPKVNEDAYKPAQSKINDPEKPIIIEDELGKETVKSPTTAKNEKTTTPSYEQITHIVKSGETLTSIAMQYNVKADDIVTWNDLPSRSLDPNQVLIIKLPKSKPSQPVTSPAQEIDYNKPAVVVEPAPSSPTNTTPSTSVREVVVQNLRNAKGIRIHKVQRGEFPNRIAAAYGVKWQQIKEWTGLSDDNIREGMELVVENPQETKNQFEKPAVEKPTPPLPEQKEKNTAQPIYHTVKQGETMFRLTQMYKVTQEQIRRWNNLSDNNIKIGVQYIVGYKNGEEPPATSSSTTTPSKTVPQKEEVNSSTAKPQYHKVQVGETLFSVAKKYGVSIEQLKKLNNIQNNVIVPGKEIRIR